MEFINRLIDGNPIYLQNNLLEIIEAWLDVTITFTARISITSSSSLKLLDFE